MRSSKTSLALTGLILLVSSPSSFSTESAHYPGACSKTTQILRTACRFEIIDDFFEGRANCVNISDRSERSACWRDIRRAKKEGWQECKEVANARREVCGVIGEARYDPEFGEAFAANFVDPLEIGKSVAPNPYFPLVSGNQWSYEGTFLDDEGEAEIETIVLTVTDKTKLIEGITCVVLSDIASKDGEVVENTDDWYAQDVLGNVWYCGEIAQNFELFEGDAPEEVELVDIDGSWKTGRDGSKAGILIPANPVVGEVIRQEVTWGEAEDMIEILSLNGSESTPAASCLNDCLVTRDFSPLDPGVEENKYYAPGIGTILEIDMETGERLELIEFIQG